MSGCRTATKEGFGTIGFGTDLGGAESTAAKVAGRKSGLEQCLGRLLEHLERCENGVVVVRRVPE
uniref:Uncharacterized protein n=1 Tax=Candidozyma auris TaxID=498019 RepID=A0A0L0P519_CANAR